MRSSVVLPAPLGPRRPVMPGMMSNDTSLTATTLPNQRETSLTRMMGVGLLIMLSFRAEREARQRMPRGAPATKGGIAIVPVEGRAPRRNRKADADCADSAVALRAN